MSWALTFVARRCSERLQGDLNRPITRGVPIAALVFFGLFAGLCHRAVRRAQQQEEGSTARAGFKLSPDVAGRALAVLFVVTGVAVGFDPRVRAVQAALLGPTPLGLPAVIVASAIQLILSAPLCWLMPHLMRLVMDARQRGGSLSKSGILLAVVQAPAELRRSRGIVIGTSLYFLVLFAGWIALTSAKGI